MAASILLRFRDPDSLFPTQAAFVWATVRFWGEKKLKKLIVILKTKELVNLILILKDLLQ